MALPTIAVLDKDSNPVTVNTLQSGRSAATDSSAVALSTEDFAAVGATNETAPASDTATSGLNGRLQRIAQRLTSIFAGLSTFGAITAMRQVQYDSTGAEISFAAGTAGSPAGGVVTVQGQTGMTPVDTTAQSVAYDVPTSITRPANTTAYTANDVVGGAIDLGVLGPSAKAVMITSAQLELDIAAVPSGMTTFTLYLYSVTPPSAIADNGAFDLGSGDRASFLGAIGLGTPVDLGSTLYVEQNAINKQVKLAGTHLFAYLVTTGGYTPAANSEVYKITLHTVAV